jgi:hypothetical protein
MVVSSTSITEETSEPKEQVATTYVPTTNQPPPPISPASPIAPTQPTYPAHNPPQNFHIKSSDMIQSFKEVFVDEYGNVDLRKLVSNIIFEDLHSTV